MDIIDSYLKNGLNCIAIDKNNIPFAKWKPYQYEIISHQELTRQTLDHRAHGFAIITGKISGNLEVIDVDVKHDATGTLYQRFIALIPTELLNRLKIVKTKSKGFHLYYRCDQIEGNKKLANRYTTEKEKLIHPDENILVLIETRGEAGYVAAPPTPGYEIIQDVPIPNITPEERNIILVAAMQLNEIEPLKKVEARHDNKENTHGDTSPWQDYDTRGVDHMITTLENHGWKIVSSNEDKVIFKRPGNSASLSSGNYNYNNGWFSVFTTSSVFENQKGYRPHAVFKILEKIDDGKKLYERLRELGYGTPPRAPNRKSVNSIKRKDGHAEHQENGQEKKNTDEEIEYYYIDDNDKVKIKLYFFTQLLHKCGNFGIYKYDKTKDYVHIRITNGLIDVASVLEIKNFVMDYIETTELPEVANEIKQAIQANSDKLFSKGNLEFLPVMELNLLKHTKDIAYFPFKNGILKVTSNEKKIIPYNEIKINVWRSHVIDFDYNINIKDPHSDISELLLKISSDNNERYQKAASVIGYMLHTYKDVSRPYAIVLAEETENEETGGGTGKGIFFRALSKMMNTVVVDGKSFKHDKPFLFQRADIDTQLIVIDDCRKNIDFQGFYSHISEGLTIEKKNRDEIHIPYSTSPKFLFSTNYNINLDGAHGRRRARVVEFSNFFHETNTPLDHFGHMLFEGWEPWQWEEFYANMTDYVQFYLANGITENNATITFDRKEIILRFSKDFIEFWDSLLKDTSEELSFVDEYNDFLVSSSNEVKDYSKKRFSAALKFTAEKFGYDFIERKVRANGGKKGFRITKKRGA